MVRRRRTIPITSSRASMRSFSTSACQLSKAWMTKHVSDPYVRRSVRENFRARSAFKLIEMNDKYKFIQPGHVVIDMGAAPGAWSQVLVKQVNARVNTTTNKSPQPPTDLLHPGEITSMHRPNPDLRCGTVIALDRDPIFDMPGVHIIDDWNLTEETTSDCNTRLQALLKRLKIEHVDGILSDMCPNVTGSKAIDHAGGHPPLSHKRPTVFFRSDRPSATEGARFRSSTAEAERLFPLQTIPRTRHVHRHAPPARISVSRRSSSQAKCIARGISGDVSLGHAVLRKCTEHTGEEFDESADRNRSKGNRTADGRSSTCSNEEQIEDACLF